MKIVTLCSGGLDSTVLLYFLRHEGHEVVALIFDYGQKHKKEISYAANKCDDLAIPRYTCYLESPIFDVPLMGGGEIPDGYYTDESMKKTIVPSRNATFLSIAFGVALNKNADAVSFAAHSGDHPIYPDCRPNFVRAMETALRIGSESNISIFTPFIGMDKTAIVEIGSTLKVDFADTWSCYKGGKFHCGKCGTCSERKEAFRLCGVKDPTIYKESQT